MLYIDYIIIIQYTITVVKYAKGASSVGYCTVSTLLEHVLLGARHGMCLAHDEWCDWVMGEVSFSLAHDYSKLSIPSCIFATSCAAGAKDIAGTTIT
jgi:hypothetical protein